MHYDLRLLRLRLVHDGDVAAVGAGVCHVDAGDGEDAGGLCSLRQCFTVVFDDHRTVPLSQRGGRQYYERPFGNPV